MMQTPMKGQDLKHLLDWSAPGEAAFAGIARYLNDAYVLEPKLDGARMRITLGEHKNTMNSGRLSDVTGDFIERCDNFPHLRDVVVPELAGTVLDGELMPAVTSMTTATGTVTQGSLNSVVSLVNTNPADAARTQQRYGNAIFMAFDVLAVKGEDVTGMPLGFRRKALDVIVAHLHTREPAIILIPQMPATAGSILRCLDAGFEGAMLKRVASTYQAGTRSPDWLKVKRLSTADFFIIGSVDGKGRNEGRVGSLQVAYCDDGKPVYVADVSGFTDAFRDELTGPDGKVKHEWLGRVIEVSAQQVTKNGRLRHPLYVRTRDDKSPADCDRAQYELIWKG